jgi:glycosyltransferase involved in cell wall biosynthesis
MSCARPSLLAIDGVARELVCDEAKAGVFAQPEDPQAIASAIKTLAADPAACVRMGAAGREWVVANASRKGLAAKYLSIMRSLT